MRPGITASLRPENPQPAASRAAGCAASPCAAPRHWPPGRRDRVGWPGHGGTGRPRWRQARRGTVSPQPTGWAGAQCRCHTQGLPHELAPETSRPRARSSGENPYGPGGAVAGRCGIRLWAETSVRIAGRPKCASAPHVDCALKYGHKRERRGLGERAPARQARRAWGSGLRTRRPSTSTPSARTGFRRTRGSDPPMWRHGRPEPRLRGPAVRCLRRPLPRASAGLAPDPLLAGSQPTLGITQGLARGAHPPFDPPENGPALGRTVRRQASPSAPRSPTTPTAGPRRMRAPSGKGLQATKRWIRRPGSSERTAITSGTRGSSSCNRVRPAIIMTTGMGRSRTLC